MKDFIKLDVVLDYDSEETQEVYVNPLLICSVKMEQKGYGTFHIFKMANGEDYTVKELPESLTL